ncbi:Tyrosine recombinase XerC [bioreactor metagenome]|uniref:Tyrosine recombinase XerC n=1 Tax=bioreactor metagenome TaxID=1076179 RepID=A0A644SVB8_9ZZZZ|nr:tyrosine-type recombinase/integrase [Negativicutes bacterium]
MATVRIERRSRKAFTLIIDHGIDPITKKRKKETRTIVTDDITVAEAERLTILAELAKGTYKPTSKATLKEYIEHWFTTPVAKKLASKTHENYRNCADLRIIPWIGNIRLKELSRSDLQRFYKQILQVGHLDNIKPPLPGQEPRKRKEIGRETLEYHHRFIHRVLNHAIFEDEILERNVATKIILPEPERETEYNPDVEIAKVFSQSEIVQLEAAAATDPKSVPYVNILTVALRTGMRREELLALRWQDIDFKSHTITVKRALIYTKLNGYEFKSTKNKKRRIIEVTEEVLNAMRAEARRQAPFKLRLKDKYDKKSKLIFCREDGFQSHPDTISSWFPSFCSSIGITRLGFHCLRHTHASHLLASGEDITYVSKRLGHSSIQVTYGTYFHFIPLEKRASLKELEKRFKK